MATTTALSDKTEVDILKHLFRNTAMPAPSATLYLALFTTMPDDAGAGGTEVSGGTYARLPVSTGASGTGVGSVFADPTPGAGTTTTVSDLFFAVATAIWGDIVCVGVYDAATAGNFVTYGEPGEVIHIGVNDQYKIPAGSMTFTLD